MPDVFHRRFFLLAAVGTALAVVVVGLAALKISKKAFFPESLDDPGHPATIALIAGPGLDANGDEISAGIHVQLNPSWKFYWRALGNGQSMHDFDWSGSENLKSAEVRWPIPGRYSAATGAPATIDDPDPFIGYSGSFVLPLILRLADPAQPARIRIAMQYSACSEICIPVQARLEMTLIPRSKPDARHAELIRTYLARTPAPNGRNGLKIERVEIANEGTIAVSARSDRPMIKPEIIVETSWETVFVPAAIRMNDDRTMVAFHFRLAGRDARSPLPPRMPEGRVRVTLADSGWAIEHEVPLP